MALSDDAAEAMATRCTKYGWRPGTAIAAHCLAAVLPDGRTIAQALADGEEWRHWGKDLAEPALRAITSPYPDAMAEARAAIKQWDASR